MDSDLAGSALRTTVRQALPRESFRQNSKYRRNTPAAERIRQIIADNADPGRRLAMLNVEHDKLILYQNELDGSEGEVENVWGEMESFRSAIAEQMRECEKERRRR